MTLKHGGNTLSKIYHKMRNPFFIEMHGIVYTGHQLNYIQWIIIMHVRVYKCQVHTI